MSFNPSEFRANFLGDGARPTAFQIQLQFPAIANSPIAGAKMQFLANASALPASSMGIAPAYYFGREIKLAGDRRFNEWQISVYNDEDFTIKNAFEAWSNAINSHSLNVRSAGALNLSGYSVDAQIIQLSKTGVPVKSYTFKGIWPIDVGEIQVSWEAQNQIETFSVTLAVNEWGSDSTN